MFPKIFLTVIKYSLLWLFLTIKGSQDKQKILKELSWVSYINYYLMLLNISSSFLEFFFTFHLMLACTKLLRTVSQMMWALVKNAKSGNHLYPYCKRSDREELSVREGHVTVLDRNQKKDLRLWEWCCVYVVSPYNCICSW